MDHRRGSYHSPQTEEEVNIVTTPKQALASLDTWSVVNEYGSIKTKVYHMVTHTDQYLHFSRNRPTIEG